MRIEFASRKLGQQMTDEASLRRHFGDLAKRLKLRMTVLVTADNLDLVPKGPPDRCHRLTGDLNGIFAVHVSGNWRILFRPDVDDYPVTADGEIDLSAITGIIILDIIDYH